MSFGISLYGSGTVQALTMINVAPNRRQIDTFTNADPDVWRHMTSHDHNEIT